MKFFALRLPKVNTNPSFLQFLAQQAVSAANFQNGSSGEEKVPTGVTKDWNQESALRLSIDDNEWTAFGKHLSK